MTPEQRLDRAERILITMAKSGRRTRSEWRYKINSLIDAQIRHEAQSHIRSAKIDEQLSENAKAIAELRESQKLTDKALRTFIESLGKNRNGNSD
jgi:thioredoxin-like negative regulator of GroEL